MVEVYTVPFVATTNAIISSSDANAGYAGNHRYFRQFLTNPAGANLVLLSNGANGAAFNTVPDVAMTNQKVNQVNPTFSTFGSATSSGSGFFDVAATADAPNASGDSWGLIQYRHWNWAADYRWQLAVQFTNADQMWARSVIAGSGSTWRRLFHTGNMGSGSGLDADTVDGKNPTATPAAGALPLADGSGTLDSWITSTKLVPSGLIAAFATAAAIPSGWSRYTAADGRLLVGAGTTFSVTYTENTNRGSNWTPFSGIGGFTGTAADTVNVTVSGSTPVSAASHQNSLSIAAQTWDPVARVVVFAIKS